MTMTIEASKYFPGAVLVSLRDTDTPPGPNVSAGFACLQLQPGGAILVGRNYLDVLADGRIASNGGDRV